MRVQSRNFCKLNQGSDYQGLILYVCFTVGHFASNITPVSYCGYLSSSLIRKSFYREPSRYMVSLKTIFLVKNFHFNITFKKKVQIISPLCEYVVR